ncbi:SDR family NAD(P)-dependent oxidoreductase [Ruicaihuangia caeni]|uniref:SDR family NAD(P)-dependent oxidoreductase n=1 Tax=Ruicaihuangia caeni TaxID=3042517 RepID=UPI003390083F
MNTTRSGLLTGKCAVITGGAGAIGVAIARRFAEHGASIALIDLDESATARIVSALEDEYGASAIGLAADVGDTSSMETAADRIAAAIGPVDTVIANAGVLVLKPALQLTKDEWNRVIGVNLGGAFTTATVFARRMRQAGQPGSVIFTSSLFGVRGGQGNAAYSASKFGVLGLAQSMAAELAPHRIRVNSVCPGQIESRMLDELFERRAERSGRTAGEERAVFESRIPIGRLGSAEEVADTFMYLASDLSRYVTGQHLVVDGGWQVG